MKNLIICFLALILGTLNLACKEEETTDDLIVGDIVSRSVNISLFDKAGTDLLDPANPNSLKRFKVYWIIDGEKVLYNEPFMAAPGAFTIEKWPLEPYYHLKVLLNGPWFEDSSDGEWTTYLEFEDGTTATIKAVYTVKPGYVMLEKASYNDIQVPAWDRSLNDGGYKTFKLVIE